MKGFSLICGILVALICIQQVNGLFFYLTEGKRKCFIEDVPKDTLVMGNFVVEDITPGEVFDGREVRKTASDTAAPNALGLVVQVVDPNKDVLLERTFSSQNRFAFSSKVPGEHVICMNTNTSRWFGAGTVVSS